MAGRIPEKFIDDLLARIDIVDVIQERVPLKKSGRDWSARCPFHDERSASFTVSPAKQFYHCFGCGEHGSAIGFLMKYDRLEFPDAIEELANRAGVKVPYEGGREAPREDATDLYTVLDAAAGYFRRQLADNDGARAYFAQRGLDEAILTRFNLGYAPDGWDGLKNALGTTPARIALLEKAGLLTHGEKGGKYDRFRDRVMFPILDRRGRTIAFGGRIIAGKPAPVEKAGDGPPVTDSRAQDGRKSDPGPKYLNSPETPLFHKGRELFGLWQVREAQSKIPRLIVVEGYMDVISLHQFGVPQAVATLGTATTRDHAEILFRQCADVFFCFDGDRAGRQAAWRAVESVLPRMRDGRQALFLFLPDGEDPDSVIRKEGLAGFEQRLKDATPLSDYFFQFVGASVDLSSADGRARLRERSSAYLKEIPDGAFRDQMLQLLQERTIVAPAFLEKVDPAFREAAREIFEEKLTAAKAELRSAIHEPADLTQRRAQQPAAEQRKTLVRATISLVIQQPSLVSEMKLPWIFAQLRQPGIPLLVELLDLCRTRPSATTGALIEYFGSRKEAGWLHQLAVSEFPGGIDEARAEFLGAIAQLEKQTRNQRRDDLRIKQANGMLTAEEKDELRSLLTDKKNLE
jgi:DNA primase